MAKYAKLCIGLILFVFTISIIAYPIEFYETTVFDFSTGDAENIDVISPDPDGLPDPDNGALIFTENDTIYVLQIYPEDHCVECLSDPINEYSDDGTPRLTFGIYLIEFDDFNSISSASDELTVENAYTGGTVTLPVSFFHIIFFGIANGYGGSSNDISEEARNAVEEFARLGKGVVFTHDVIAKRWGRDHYDLWPWEMLCCSVSDNFEHPNFNNMTELTGLRAEWVDCCVPDETWTHVQRAPGADGDAIVMNVPFVLPEEFDVTECHDFGEVHDRGDLWYVNDAGIPYMHTYNDPEHNSFFSFFSTGHESEELRGSPETFRPIEWEAKAMINSMYYAYNGGVGVGDYKSDVKSLPGIGTLERITWSETVPELASLSVQARISLDDVDWTDWFDVEEGEDLDMEFRYFQYRVLMDRGVGRPIFHWILIEADVPAPEVTLLYPTEITSCECARVAWLVEMPDSIDIEPGTMDAMIEGHGFDYTSFRVSGDTLFFEPEGEEGCFEHGDTVTGVLTNVRNTAGFSIYDPDTFEIIFDLLPPEITDLSPNPDTLIADPSFDIHANIADDLSGIDATGFLITVNGILIEDGILFEPVTGALSIDGDEAGIYTGDSVEVCITAIDNAAYCDRNSNARCWSFFVDTLPPEVELIEPTIYTSCPELSMIFEISDLMGVDETSITITVEGSEYDYPDYMTFEDGNLEFEPPISMDDGDEITVYVSVSDNVANTLESEAFSVTRDFAPPYLVDEYPEAGYVIGDSITDIYFNLDDELSGFDTSTVSIMIDGVSYDPIWDGTRFYLSEDVVPHFDDYDTVEVCTYFQDLAGYCGENEGDTCWSFSINLSGPIANFIMPEDETVTSCNEGPLYLSIRDVNGVVESSIEFYIDGEFFTTTSPSASYIGDTLIYTPSPAWSHGDTVDVMVTAAEDSLGNPISDTLEGRFYVDTSPPHVLPIYPRIGGTAAGDPVMSIYIYDEIAGIDPSSIIVDVNDTELRYIDSPAGMWLSDSEDTIYIDFAAAGLSFEDTAYIEIQIADAPDFCEANSTTFEYFFVVDMVGPEAYFILPDSGAYSSCENQEIRLWLYDDNGLDLESMVFNVNDSTFPWPASELSLNDDTLIFRPTAPFGHGDSITASLMQISDTLGNEHTDEIFTEFYIDIEPPELLEVSPEPDSVIIGQFDVPVWFIIDDDMCGIDFETMIFTIDSDTLDNSHLDINGDTVYFDPSDVAFSYSEDDSFDFTIYIADCAEYCGANDTFYNTNFYIPDDDTLPPIMHSPSPSNWVQDSAFYIEFALEDSSGIFITGDFSDAQAAYIEWDTDGELDISSNRIYIEFHDFVDGDSIYRSRAPIPAQDGDIIVSWRLHCYDNDFDLDNRDDRTLLLSEIHEVNIAPRPDIELIHPPNGSVIACQSEEDHVLFFSIHSEEQVEESSIEIEIDGEIFTLSDYRLELTSPDTIVFSPSEPFDQGSLLVRLNGLSDIYGYEAVQRTWHLVFDFSPPQLWFSYPEPGEMIPDDAPYVEFGAMDYFSDVNTNAFAAYILSAYYDTIATVTSLDCIEETTDSSGTWDINFNACGFDYSGYDSFTVIVYAEDSPDFCSPNWRTDTLKFWVEPDLDCGLSTNPFTPNDDGYNDDIDFSFPNLYSLGGKIEIFDMRGQKARTIEVDAGEIEKSVFDGKSDNDKDLPSGTYLYIITVDGERVCKGTLTLIR
ncbi:MAG: gliding motility-associated C-terminal domain-containing protein [Candidatus Zixiibacteriota bacterium]